MAVAVRQVSNIVDSRAAAKISASEALVSWAAKSAALTVSKVFLIDASDLTGLYRVASFLGLGLSLIGIGYLYQRLLFRRGE